MTHAWQHQPLEACNPFQPNFGQTAGDYHRFRTGFPAELFTRLEKLGVLLAGERVLDIGTGTGFLARDLALRGCHVFGLDPQADMLEQARALDIEIGLTTRYVKGRAEQLPFDNASFDIVTAGQCWHWFDRPVAAREALRVLGGKLVICHFDWLPLAGNVVEATERLVQQYNPQWNMGGGTGIYPHWLRDVEEAGFVNIESFSFDCDVRFSPESWLGRMRASSGIGASLPAERIEKFERDLRQLLLTHFPGEALVAPHRVFAVVSQKPQFNA